MAAKPVNTSKIEVFKEMIKILFICHGNICRSPMGEYILKDMVMKRGLSEEFHIESAATSTEEIGNPVYPPARAELMRHGISCEGHHARQVKREDYDNFDIIIVMEKRHADILKNRFFNGDPQGKIRLAMDLAGKYGQSVDDPWYTGRFKEVYDQLCEASEGLLNELNM